MKEWTPGQRRSLVAAFSLGAGLLAVGWVGFYPWSPDSRPAFSNDDFAVSSPSSYDPGTSGSAGLIPLSASAPAAEGSAAGPSAAGQSTTTDLPSPDLPSPDLPSPGLPSSDPSSADPSAGLTSSGLTSAGAPSGGRAPAAADPSTMPAELGPAERLAAADIHSDLPPDGLKGAFSDILHQIGTRCGTRDYENVANVILATQQQLIGKGAGRKSLLEIGLGLESSMPAKSKPRLRALAVDYVMRQSRRGGPGPADAAVQDPPATPPSRPPSSKG